MRIRDWQSRLDRAEAKPRRDPGQTDEARRHGRRVLQDVAIVRHGREPAAAVLRGKGELRTTAKLAAACRPVPLHKDAPAKESIR